jgi:hypothetical protein
MMFVGEIKNKNYNDSLTIYRAEKISSAGSSKMLIFLLKGWIELLENQFSQILIPFTDNSKIVWVEALDKKILGVICYDYQEEHKCGWIHLSYTDINERGKGINKICYKIVENDCKKLGASHLSSFVNIRNKIRLDSSPSVGMITTPYSPTHYKMYKKIT